MKNILLSTMLLGLTATSAFAADYAPSAPPVPSGPPPFTERLAPVVAQFGPTTGFSTINCSNWARLENGSWKALNPTLFSLGFVQDIVPPLPPVKLGGFIYNNVDLFSQLTAQCSASVVTARY